MNLSQFIDHLQSADYRHQIEFLHTVEEKPAVYSGFPAGMRPEIIELLEKDGIHRLYSHQAEAFELYRAKKNFVITTPTASGKTLAYLLPVLQNKLENQRGRHLFMFPTKALARDQLAVFRTWREGLNTGWKIGVYDGDTPPEERRNIKQSGDLMLSNPDMLHAGILPHHLSWRYFFENLRTIVIDEMHSYLGIFGSHVANVLRRLQRILDHYESDPLIIFSSATIANPAEHARNLTGREFTHIGESGAPEGKKYYTFYNPPLVGEEGIRQSPYRSAAAIGAELVKNNIPTIFFARSRNRVEVLTTFLRKRLPPHQKNKVMGYRGGYLPNERRRIERDLREGRLTAVVSTNALELGIDIGSLSAVVSIGYPGRISSLLQQFGRAGRQKEPALAVMIATMSALDQYLMKHPEYILETGGEAAIINPHNMMILMEHIKCAAFELRFKRGEEFAGEVVDPFLDYLTESGVLNSDENTWFWANDTYPASDVSLRSAAKDNFVIVDKTRTGSEKVIGEIDYFAAPMMIHDEAIYQHQGRHYFVDILKWDERRAEVREVKSDYYTDAHQKVHLAVLARDEAQSQREFKSVWGEVTVRAQAHLYKKIKIETSENLGWGQIHTPEIEMHTQAAWFEIGEALMQPYALTLRNAFLIRLAYIFKEIAPLVALCDMNDITVQGIYRDPQFAEHTVVFYDRFPGGVGISHRIVREAAALFELAHRTITECSCSAGCPSCVGVWAEEEVDEHELNLKEATAGLIAAMAEQ